MTRSPKAGWAALAALSVVPALLILLQLMSPEIPPGLGPTDQYITRSEAWPFVIYLAVPVTILIVAIAGFCIISVAKRIAQYLTIFVVLTSLVVSLSTATLYLVSSGVEQPTFGLYTAAAIVGIAPSATFGLVAGLPWWVQRRSEPPRSA